MKGLWIGKTGNANSWYHISIIACSSVIKSLTVVRHEKPPRKVPCNKVHYTLFKNSNSILYFLKLFLFGLKEARKKPDFIISFSVFPYGVAAYLVSVLTKRKLILGFIGTDYNKYFLKSKFRWLLKKAAKRCAIVICQSKHMEAGLREIGIPENKIEFHPQFVADEWFIERTNDVHKYDLITACNLTKNKSIDTVIKALSILKNKGILLSLCVLGKGDEESYLKTLTKELGLKDQVFFLGYQNDVPLFFSKSSIYIQASVNEGLSLSLIEALASGLVPVSTIAGSERDVISDGRNGLFFETGNSEDLANKLHFLQNEDNFKEIQNNVLYFRENLRFSKALIQSDRILKKIENEH